MQKALLSLVALLAVVSIVFFAIGLYSETISPSGLANGQLSPCPEKPNCISSESAPSDDHAVAALAITPFMGEEPLLKVKEVIELLGGDVNYSDETYMASTFTSTLFGFVDDVELRFDQGNNLLHVRSSSRVGYSDFNVNRRRVERIRELLSIDLLTNTKSTEN